MPTPTIPALGASTLNRKWVSEVNTSTPGTPNWVPIGGVKSSQLNVDSANWVDDSDFSAAGYGSQTKTASTWGATLTVGRKVQQGTVAYDVAQEYLRTHAIGVFGTSNTVQIRVYEYDPNDPSGTTTPRAEAYMGFVGVEWAPQGGDNKAVDDVQVTLNGQGKLNLIGHPYPAVATVPTVTSITPSALLAAGGQLVQINGSGFTGTVSTTGVKFGGTNAPSWDVVSDGIIVALSPAHTAGTAQVVVTNAAGASTSVVNATYS